MIDRQTVDRIVNAAQIEDVVSDFVTLKRSGANLKGLCPFHDERTPSFVVSPAKNYCKCFSCGKGGNPLHFIMEHEQMTYPEALRYLAKKYKIEIQERELSQEEKQAQNERESMFILNEWARDFFQDTLYHTTEGQAIGMAYFRSRGFRDDIIKKFGLGYCPAEKYATAKAARAKGFNEKFLESTGLCYRQDSGKLHDRFWGRVIFPCYTLSGKVVAFGGRVLDAATKGVKVKYVNSPESEIYKKSNELYGLFQAKQAIVKNDRCYLVEGYTDVLSMHQSGIENVVSSSGTSLTEGQIRLIRRFTNNITVLYDGDAAGIKASLRGIDMLLAEDMRVKVLLLPDGDDPDSFAQKHNATEYQDYIEKNQVDFIQFKANLLMKEATNDPMHRAEMINSLVASIAMIPDEIIRSVYTRTCSQMMDMDERILLDAVAKMKRKHDENVLKARIRQSPGNRSVTTTNSQDGLQIARLSSAENLLPEGSLTSDTPTSPPEDEAWKEEQVITSDQTRRRNLTPQEESSDKRLNEKETLLMQMLIRKGERKIILGEGEEISVGAFIAGELAQDGLVLQNALHQKILDEFLAHQEDTDFNAERYYLNHPDEAISQLTFELSTDRYELSKSNQEADNDKHLTDKVDHILLDYKMEVVRTQTKSLMQQLKNPEVLKDTQKCTEIMSQFQMMKEVEKELAKHLGERVILG